MNKVGKKLTMQGNTGEAANVSAAFGRLTKRQSSVLALMLEGLSDKDIAQRLHLSKETAKEHVSAILKRLGVGTRSLAMSQMNRLRVREVQSAANSLPCHMAVSEHGVPWAPLQPISISPQELGLTERQGAVLVHLLEGSSNKDIAERLHLSEETVKDHVSAILKCLGVRTRKQVMSQMKNYCVHLPS